MPAIATVEEFLRLVEKSGLVEARRLEQFLAAAGPAADVPRHPGQLAAALVRQSVLTAYQARQLLAGKWQRFTLLGKYKILEVIGVGGMGKVFLCEHMLLRRLVAVKVLPIAKSENPLTLERFYREARAVAMLDHPNIVRCFDVDRDGLLHFMVMEYVDGSSLDKIVRDFGPMDPLRAAHYLHQAACGLQFAHQSGWIHRDIKPANILLDRAGVIKVLDMGLARLVADPADNLTQQHGEATVLGTADYIAPEQAVSSHEVDIRADIYSLGCTAYFLLTGQPPFAEGTIGQKLIWHQMREPEPLDRLRPDLPAGLAAVVRKMLAKHPADRQQLPQEVAQALQPWVASPIPPPPASEMPRPEPLAASGPAGAGHSLPPLGIAADSIAGFSAFGSAPLDDGSSPTVETRRGNTPPGSFGPLAEAAATSPVSAPVVAPPTTSSASQLKPPERLTPATIASRRDPRTHSADQTRFLGPMAPPQPAAPAPSPAKRRRAPALIVAGLTLAAGAAALLGWQLGGFAPATSAAPASAPAATPSVRRAGELVVTRNRQSQHAGQAHAFESVQAALARAKAGDRILLLDQFHEERLVLDGNQALPRDVTITSGHPSGKVTVWQLPASAGDNEPLLRLTNVAGLRFQRIALDGERRTDRLVELSGRCPGLTFDDCELRGGRRTALTFAGCTGEVAAPVCCQRLRVRAGQGADAALQVIAPADGAVPATQYLVVRECRFEGPFQAVVSVRGPLLNAEFARNRCFQAKTALRYARGHLLQAGFTGNTFCQLETLFAFDGLPPARPGEPAALTVRGNLIAQTPALVRFGEPVPPEQAALLFAAEDNVADPDSAQQGLAFQPAQRLPVALGTDPENDRLFLSYPKDSPLGRAGPGGGPVGVAPRE